MKKIASVIFISKGKKIKKKCKNTKKYFLYLSLQPENFPNRRVLTRMVSNMVKNHAHLLVHGPFERGNPHLCLSQKGLTNRKR
jgi:hypothetical protein